ncbi:MAG: hypothetical protein N3A63_04500 [Bacteroidetes bacterium]|nr:hypothetical protein [Bacteroidota bacterium]
MRGKAFIVGIVICVSILAGCSSVVLKPADFSWPIESVLKVNEKGLIQDQRHCFTLNVRALFYLETNDSVNITVPVRVIRDREGYYYMTAQKFKNVYVFEHVEGGLKLVNTILITTRGLGAPAFNQRAPYIQLVNEKDPPRMLTKDGIVEGGVQQ